MHRSALRRSPPLVGATLALILLGAMPGIACASDLTWHEDDWSGGRYSAVSGADPEIHPGLLVLENLPGDMRFVAEPTDFTGIYALAVYHDTLFVGASPYPLTGDGADIMAYDYLADSFRLAYQPYEQGVIAMKVFGDTLYVPGPDSRDPHTEPGCIFLYNGEQWIEKQTIPDGVHIFDVTVIADTMYVTDGSRTGPGNVWMSTDWGDSWTNLLAIQSSGAQLWRRFYGIGRFQGRLYAQPDGYAPETEMLFVREAGTWDTLSTPLLPSGSQGLFTAWGDSLIFTIDNHMNIIHGDEVDHGWMPFSGNRWCRSVHIYEDMLYGGARNGYLYSWTPQSDWTLVDQLGLTPSNEEIEALVTCYGRLYAATSRLGEWTGGRLYVSAAVADGYLDSSVHDFGVATRNGLLIWDDVRPGAGNTTRFQLRSGATLAELEAAAFVGPDGTNASYYMVSGTPLQEGHHGHRHFQYRAELLCPAGLRMPMIRSITLATDSLPSAGIERTVPENAGVWLHLSPAHPNPATRCTQLTLRGRPGVSAVRVSVCDVQGRSVHESRLALPGSSAAHTWQWDLREAGGDRVPAGIYCIRVSANGRTAARRTVLALPR